MGATGLYRPKGISHKDFFQQQWDPEGKRQRVLAAAASGSVVYCAVEQIETGHVFPVAVQTWRHPRAEQNFTYKEATESQGPNEIQCPQKILDMLSPLDEMYEPGSNAHTWAKQWRDDCIAFNQRMQSQPKIKPGDAIKLSRKVEFQNGIIEDVFIFKEKSSFYPICDSGMLVSLGRSWKKNYDWKLVDADKELHARENPVREIIPEKPVIQDMDDLLSAASDRNVSPAGLTLDM